MDTEYSWDSIYLDRLFRPSRISELYNKFHTLPMNVNEIKNSIYYFVAELKYNNIFSIDSGYLIYKECRKSIIYYLEEYVSVFNIDSLKNTHIHTYYILLNHLIFDLRKYYIVIVSDKVNDHAYTLTYNYDW